MIKIKKIDQFQLKVNILTKNDKSLANLIKKNKGDTYMEFVLMQIMFSYIQTDHMGTYIIIPIFTYMYVLILKLEILIKFNNI